MDFLPVRRLARVSRIYDFAFAAPAELPDLVLPLRAPAGHEHARHTPGVAHDCAVIGPHPRPDLGLGDQGGILGKPPRAQHPQMRAREVADRRVRILRLKRVPSARGLPFVDRQIAGKVEVGAGILQRPRPSLLHMAAPIVQPHPGRAGERLQVQRTRLGVVEHRQMRFDKLRVRFHTRFVNVKPGVVLVDHPPPEEPAIVLSAETITAAVNQLVT